MSDLDLDAILRAADPTTPEAWSQKMRDQAFVIHAREDVPALVAEVRRLRALVAGDDGRTDYERLYDLPKP